MTLGKPNNHSEYKRWLVNQLRIDPSNISESRYIEVSSVILTSFKNSEFWTQFSTNIQEFNDEYYSKTGYSLVSENKNFNNLFIKPYSSFIDKTYRKNILNNKNWDSPPASGWVIPDMWYSNISDIVRTAISVKYMDGVIFLRDKLINFCKSINLGHKVIMEKRDDGHYAAHFYVTNICEIPLSPLGLSTINSQIEIQINTQLQETIKDLLHKNYETTRSVSKKKNEDWQWDYKSDEFSSNYLGHLLQYVDGKIVEIREKQHDEEKNS